MPAKGGRGHKSAQHKVLGMREEGLSEEDIRSRLREEGYKSGRISQLLALTRPELPALPVAEAPQPARKRARKKEAPQKAEIWRREKSPQPRQQPLITDALHSPSAHARSSAAPPSSPWKHAADDNSSCRQLVMDGDAEEVEAELLAHALSVKDWLTERHVDGDGHCMFRAVARQTVAGETSHPRLRQAVVREARLNRADYAPWFAGEALDDWLLGMSHNRWGDDAAVQACCNLLSRPVVIYRKGSDQAPTLKIPRAFQPTRPFTVIYLLLDEAMPGCEHYNALEPGLADPLRRSAEAQADARAEAEAAAVAEAKAEGEAEAEAKPQAVARVALKKPAARGRKRPASGGRKTGWVCDNFDAVQGLLAEGVSQKEIQRQLGGDRGGRRVSEIKKHIEAGTRPPSLAAGGVGERQLRRLRREERQESAAEAWEAERSMAFCALGEAAAFAKIKRRQSSDTELLERDWAVQAAWTFCPLCGRRRADGKLTANWQRRGAKAAAATCAGGCDLEPAKLDEPAPETEEQGPCLKAYVTPAQHHWQSPNQPNLFKQLSAAEATSLALLDIKCDYKVIKGGGAPMSNKKKTAVVKAVWRGQDVEASLSAPAKLAFDWLCANNATYARWLRHHRQLLADNQGVEGWRPIPTAQLLLRMHGVEVAARPWLYPAAAFGDTDIRPRLLSAGRITEKQRPSTKASFLRKLLSRCQSYQADFQLLALLHDIALARQINGLVKAATDRGLALEEATVGMQNFSAFWAVERSKLEDVCRQREMPNLFFTVAPAEWKFQLHEGMFGHCQQPDALEKAQAALALHMRHVLAELVEKCVLNKDDPCRAPGIKAVRDYSLRFEFQGRGTLHVHVVAWVVYDQPEQDLSGRSGQAEAKSPLLLYLERLFDSRVDVQCQRGEHCLLSYVTGYLSKASDALAFSHKEWSSARDLPLSQWRQTYRLLCKRAPLEPEIALEFAAAPLMQSSYRGASTYAPLPWPKAKRDNRSDLNQARKHYLAYLQWNRTLEPETKFGRKLSFAEWFRCYSAVEGDNGQLASKERGTRGVGCNKETCAAGLKFAFELLDIFVGQFCASFIPHCSEDEFLLSEEEAKSVPEGARFLAAALRHPWLWRQAAAERGLAQASLSESQVLEFFLQLTTQDLRLRGLPRQRIRTFSARIRATHLLLRAATTGQVDPLAWSAQSVRALPQRRWSPQQKQVLETIAGGLAVCDANAAPNSRVLLVTGGPGTGKTEVVAHAAAEAAADGCKVLIACPTGVLVAAYKGRVPAAEDIVVETVHASFQITREADAQYVPPGRLRHFDLIIFDEISQLADDVWQKVQTGLAELSPGPVVAFVGDFQQLQPVTGQGALQEILQDAAAKGSLRHTQLQQHEFARSKDAVLLNFLAACRVRQPARRQLEDFFGSRRLPADLPAAVSASLRIEACLNQEDSGRQVTFLTVTNKAARDINMERLRQEFPAAAAALLAGNGLPGDEQAGGGKLVFQEGMRVRLTRNLDKERGFVNGALGVVQTVLRKDVFILETTEGNKLLVHPVHEKDGPIMPCVYGYALTIRRAQGSTLDFAILFFDRRRPDRGYAYVGASRVRQAKHLCLMGKIRRTDWLPVGKQPEDQIYPSFLSDSDLSAPSSDAESSEAQPSSSDFDSASSEAQPSASDFSGASSDAVSEPSDSDVQDDAVAAQRFSGFSATDQDLDGLFGA